VAIPKLGTTLPPAVPNWLQSLLKPRAWLCMEVVTDRGDQRPRVDLNEIRGWARSKADSAQKWNWVLMLASKVQWPELSQLSLCLEFDKENSIEFSLIPLPTYTLCYCGYALTLPWSSCYSSHVTHCDCDLWYCDKVTWLFPALYLVVVSPIKEKEKEKKRNINNDLAVLPSHDKPHPNLWEFSWRWVVS